MGVSRRLISVVFAVATIGLSVPASSSAWLSAAGSCFAGVFSPVCETPKVMDGTFTYVIVNNGPVQWSVDACGYPDCVSVGAWAGSSTVGTLTVTGCPCFARIGLFYQHPPVPNPIYAGNSVGFVTSLGP